MTDYYTKSQLVSSKMCLCLRYKISNELICCEVINLSLFPSEQFLPVYPAAHVQ